MRLSALLAAPTLALAALAATASPAAARDYGRDDGPHYSHTPQRAQAIRHQIDQLRQAVNRTDRRDRISEREAAGLRRDVANLQDQFRSYNRNGLSNPEMRTLERRIADIRGRLRYERWDRDGRRG